MIAWVNMLMLSGLAALGIPIVIHLLRNRRFEPADLGSLRFLRQAVRESARWRRIRDLLLLLLRLLAIALLTLLFARPYWIRQGSAQDRDVETVLLLDTSGSMAGRMLGGTVWRAVVDDAAEVQARLPESASSVNAVFADRVMSVGETLPEEPVKGAATDYAAALRWAADRLRSSKATHREVILVTDLQRAALPEAPLTDWPADVPVRLRTIPVAGPYNLAIGAITCLTPAPQGEALFAVRLLVSGDCPLDTVEVVFGIEGQEDQKRTLTPQSQDVVFSWDKPAGGICRGHARVGSADAWPVDDALNVACELSTPLPVTLVDASQPERPQDRESYFLAAALSEERDGKGRALYSLTTTATLSKPADAALVALCDTPPLNSDQARDLAEAVRRGTGLLIFMGDATSDGAYRALEQAGLMPFDLSRSKVPVPAAFSEWETTHPAMRQFGAAETGNLRRIVFRDVFRISPRPDATVLARLTGGHPAVLASSLGRGRVIVVTNPCSRAWTDWPTERIFLPLMRELTGYAARLDEHRGNVALHTASMADGRDPGVYDDDGGVTVVVPDANETVIDRCTEAEFRLALGIGPAPSAPLDAAGSGLPPSRERRNEWWRWLALALAAVLLIESITADWPSRTKGGVNT